MPDPISRNPISGHAPAPSAFNYVDKATSAEHRVVSTKTDDGATKLQQFSQDKVGINQRRNGHWKVGAFHVFNFLTAGIVGYTGKLCANSSRMGSQKSGWFTNVVKDYGQTYLNATQDSGKVINTLTKGWSEGLGSVATVGMGPLGRLVQNSSHNKAVNQAFGNAMQREFGAQRNYNSIKDLNQHSVQQAEKDVYRKLNAEASTVKGFAEQDLLNTGDYTTNAVRMVTYTGSDSMKAAFSKFAANEHSAENALFCQWSSPTLDKLDPQSPNHDPDYTLSKKELLTVQQDFVESAGKYELNLSSGVKGGKRQRDGSTSDGLAPALTRALGDYQNRLNNAQQQVKLNPNSPEARKNLQAIENERLSLDDSQAMLPHLQNADKDISSVVNDTFARFSTHVNEKVNQLGVAPQLEKQVEAERTEMQSLSTDIEKDIQNTKSSLAQAEKDQKLAQMHLDEKPNDWYLKRTRDEAADKVTELKDQLQMEQDLLRMAKGRPPLEVKLQAEYQSILQNNPNVFAIDTGEAKPEDVQQLHAWLGQHKNQQICAKPNNNGGWDFYVDRGKTASKEDRLNVAKPLMQIGQSVAKQNLQKNLETLNNAIDKLDKEINDPNTYFMLDHNGNRTGQRQRIDGRTALGDQQRLQELQQQKERVSRDLQTLQQPAANVADIRGIEAVVQGAFIDTVPKNWTPPQDLLAQGTVDPDDVTQAAFDHAASTQGLTGAQLQQVMVDIFAG
ncbi:MAG: hypothetical protein HC808_18265 [Candidatus Competibacteraceae bacterium]|nr:hypothetical protein [Candidatus Competibacteraceae bacterium]